MDTNLKMEDVIEEDFWKEMAKYDDAIIEVKRNQIKQLSNERLLSRRVLKRVKEYYDDLGRWEAEGIVEIVLTDELKSGRDNKCARIKDAKERYLFHRQVESEVKGINHIYLWQNNGGYLGDDYAGWALIPLSDGRYWKLSYSC